MKEYPHHFIRVSTLATLFSLPLFAAVPAALAQVQFNPPPLSAPGNREAGGIRSDTCATTTESQGLIALLPETNLGLTTEAYPTFFAYIPSNNAARAEFRLYKEATGAEVYVGQVVMPPATDPDAAYRYESSVVSIAMPDDGSAPALEANESYLWALMLVCNAGNRAEDIVVTGVIQRVGDDYLAGLDPAISHQLDTLNTVPIQDQVSIYGAAGIWHDMLSELALLTSENPETYEEEWNMVLSAQGLGAIANAPLFVSEIEPLEVN